MDIILPKFYYINLDRAKDREEHMAKFFKKLEKKTKLKARYSRVSGLDAKTENLEKFSNLKVSQMWHRKENNFKARPAEFGVCYSHLKAMKTFLDDESNTDEYAFICEDDLELFRLDKNYFQELLSTVIKKGEDCDIISVACGGSPNLLTELVPKIKEPTFLSFMENRGRLYGAVCYLITRKLAKKIIDLHWKNDKFIIPKDHNSMVSDHFIYPLARNACFLIPSLFTLRKDNDSYIHPEHLPMHENVQQLLFLMWHNIGAIKK
jgi:GR25 family glycosyltransferase involved in LPS biosynthesis